MALATVSTAPAVDSWRSTREEPRSVNSLSALRRLNPEVSRAIFENVLFIRSANLDGTPRGFAAESSVFAPNAFFHHTSLAMGNCRFEENAYVGPYCEIGKGSIISKSVKLEFCVLIADEVKIGERSSVKTLTRIGYKATIGQQVDIGFDVRVATEAAIFDQAVLESHVRVGQHAILGRKCLLETGAKIGADVRLGELGMMERHSQILDHSGTWDHVNAFDVVSDKPKTPFYLQKEYLERGPFGHARR